MANIFNADNGVVSGSAGIKLSSDTTGVLNIQTNGTTAISVSSSQVVSFPATSGISFAGQITFAAGTAAAPSISVTGDTNTGIYFPGADQVAISTGGTQRVLVDASGVTTLAVNPVLTSGTANGVAYLNGSKSLTSGSALVFDGTRLLVGKSSSDVNNWGIQNYSVASAYASGIQLTYGGVGAAGLWIPTGSALAFGADGGSGTTELMRLTSTGLGIGTSSPAQKLHVAVTAGVYNATVTNVSDIGGGALVRGTTSGTNSRVGLFLQGSDQIGAAIASAREDSGLTWKTYLAFYTNNLTGGNVQDLQEKMRIDSSGNLGLGVTPSAWGSIFKVLQFSGGAFIGQNSDAALQAGHNVFYNGTNYVYSASGKEATRYAQTSGQHLWFTAASGTAGNAITFTQAMTLDASGNLNCGTTGINSNFRLQIKGPSGNGCMVFSPATDGATVPVVRMLNAASDTNVAEIGTASATALYFSTGGTERARITSGGDFGIGTTSPTQKLDVNGIIYTNNQYRVGSNNAGSNTGIIKWNSGNSLGIYTWGDALNIEIGGSNVLFKTETGTERARITSGGNLLVGMTSTPNLALTSCIGHVGEANGVRGSTNMSGATWVNLVTLPTPSIAGARVNILGNENGNVNTYYGTWIIAYNSSGWGITGPFNENQRGNDYGVPNLRISGGNIQVQARNGVSTGIIYYNIEYFSV